MVKLYSSLHQIAFCLSMEAIWSDDFTAKQSSSASISTLITDKHDLDNICDQLSIGYRYMLTVFYISIDISW